LLPDGVDGRLGPPNGGRPHSAYATIGLLHHLTAPEGTFRDCLDVRIGRAAAGDQRCWRWQLLERARSTGPRTGGSHGRDQIDRSFAKRPRRRRAARPPPVSGQRRYGLRLGEHATRRGRTARRALRDLQIDPLGEVTVPRQSGSASRARRGPHRTRRTHRPPGSLSQMGTACSPLQWNSPTLSGGGA